jgi:hypothetical protein
MNKKVAAGIGLIAGALGLYLWTKKAKPCTEGTKKCVGADLYTCINGKWVLTEANSPTCVTLPSCSVDADCPPGYVCQNGVCVPAELPPEELPSNFEIDVVNVTPNIVAVGDEMTIYVRWWCPGHIGETFTLHCTVDGTILSQTFVADDDFGFVYYKYTPQKVGTYTATVRGVSCSFEAREKISGVFYDPYDGYQTYDSLNALAFQIGAFFEGTVETWTDGGDRFAGYVFTCPYCDFHYGPYSPTSDKIRINYAYGMLTHIQSAHPEYPLTKPRPFIEVTTPAIPKPLNVWFWMPAYKIVLNGRVYTQLAPSTELYGALLGINHIEISGTCSPRDIFDGRQCGQIVFSQDVTLLALGDKVTIDAETGLVGYHKWSVPV